MFSLAPAMWLTDDDIIDFSTRRGTVPARVRIWRQKRRNPVVLVEPVAGGRTIEPFASTIATYLRNAVLMDNTFLYVEHEEFWNLVAFDSHRHYCVRARRTQTTRFSIEYAVGEKIK